MMIDTLFRRMPPSPRLHGYARQKLESCAELWNRRLDLRLTFAQEPHGVSVELCGRDSDGHYISCHGQGADGFRAIDNLCHKLGPQGLLLSHNPPPPMPFPSRRPGNRKTPLL
ncbi:HPF/RaiA family ribosome-associated protein [Oligoflexus tunisiensis]|uniref:HPF/RaiA family ribosome-associated protein n=1 Tax=Oligoflexus tunisiensis TaxID=708132 RepID=UPI00114D1B90|nr:HPF/RaiA family ribosome-associated protein [Oligoflexus tunisiensis]